MRRESEDLMGFKDLPDPLVKLGHKGYVALLVQRDQLEPPAHKALKDNRDLKDHEEIWVRVC